jgi:putative addiction module CopG family antidote
MAAEHGTEGLPPELAAAVGERLRGFVADQVRSGRHRDAAEVARAPLHLLEEQEWPEGLPSDAEIRAMVEEGPAGGVSDEDPDAFFGRLDAKYAAMEAKQREKG